MNREQVLEFLLKELEKVPNRDVCRVATEEQMKRIAAELDFEAILEFLLDEDLKLCISEIPEGFHMEIILYFAMMTEVDESQFPYEGEIWDLFDKATGDFVANVKQIFLNSERQEIASIWSFEFLEYAKSDKPDF